MVWIDCQHIFEILKEMGGLTPIPDGGGRVGVIAVVCFCW